MIKTVKLKNAKKRVFNGIQPGATINVEASQVAGYLRNGFVEVKQAIQDQKNADQAKAKADAKAKKDAEKAKADAKKQADAQAELDAEYNEANGVVDQPENDTDDQGSDDAENDGSDDTADQDADGQDQDATADAETAEKAESGTDVDALNAELETVPEVKKNGKKSK